MHKGKLLIVGIVLLISILVACGLNLISNKVWMETRLSYNDFIWYWISIPGPWIGPSEELYFNPDGSFIYSDADNDSYSYGTWDIVNNNLQIEAALETDVIQSYALQDLEPTYQLNGKNLSIDSIIYNGKRFWKQYDKHDWELFGGDYINGNGELTAGTQ